MAISIPDRVVAFDYGEVISMSPSEHDRKAMLGVALSLPEPFWAAYWRHRPELDVGTLSNLEYWRRIEADLGVRWSPAVIQRLWAIDLRSWISVEPGTIDVIAELHEGGTRLALLSNAGFEYAEAFRRSPMSAFFERVFTSAELGLLKPDQAIYRAVCDALGVAPERLVMIDNKAENVAGAVAAGATGHVFRGVSGLRSFLAGLAA